MKKLYLNRFFADLNNTLGCLEVEGLEYPIYTNELPWKFNLSEKSCIPDGIYEIRPYKSHNHGDCFKILNVTGRTSVLIHVGNVHSDSLGCILVGLNLGTFNNNEEAVLNSLKAMGLLKELITGPAELHIRSTFV